MSVSELLNDIDSLLSLLQQPASERCGERYCIHCGRRDTNADYCGKQRGLQKCVFPATEATQVAVEAPGIAVVIKQADERFEREGLAIVYQDNRGRFHLNTGFIDHIATEVSRHCTADAGEVERLRGERDAWRRGAMLLLDELGDYESGSAPHIRVRRLRQELATTRANAIRECVEVLKAEAAEAKEIGKQFAPLMPDASDMGHLKWIAREGAMNDGVTLLESLTKKEGDDGPTNNT
jgi:hypothetical protein